MSDTCIEVYMASTPLKVIDQTKHAYRNIVIRATVPKLSE